MWSEVTIGMRDATERAIVNRAIMQIEEHRHEFPKSDVQETLLMVDEATPIAPEVLACILKQPEVVTVPTAPAHLAPMTDTDFLDRFATLARQHGIPETIKLLNERYGVNRASEVPSDKRQDLLDTLTGLVGGGAA